MTTITIDEGLAEVFGSTPVVAGFDCTHINVPSAPRGAQLAGYTTGTPDIRWTDSDWRRFPGAVRIDQDFAATDPSADVLDVESGAATPGDCPHWATKAVADFITAVRPGQRTPVIYTSADNVTNVVNALVNGGVKGGVGLWVANWNLTESQAIADVKAASGPFPIVGVQYGSGTWGDFDVWGAGWLSHVSGDFATNPVSNLHQIHRGFTSATLAWDRDKNATFYTIEVYWRGRKVKPTITSTTPDVRVGRLLPIHTYEFRVRAHPGGSTGADASIKVTTR